MANTPQNMIFWNTLGYQSEVKTEVRKRTPPKRTLWGSIGCLGSPMMIFGSPLGFPFWRRNDTWRPADRLQGPSWFHYIDSASTKWHLASCWQAWSPLLSLPQVHSDVGSHLWNRSLSVVLKNVRAVSLSLLERSSSLFRFATLKVNLAIVSWTKLLEDVFGNFIKSRPSQDPVGYFSFQIVYKAR